METAEVIGAGTPLSQKDFHLAQATSQFEIKGCIIVHLLIELQISGV